MRELSRRSFVRSTVAGATAVVLGFDPSRRQWVTSAQASEAISIPRLDGMLVTDAATLETYAEDFGRLERHTPRAVLLPVSVSDIVKTIKFCRRHNIKVVGRGDGHSSGGQTLVEAGVVIDMSVMNEIESVSSTSATVQAGVTLKELLAKGIPLGSRPPVVTGFVGLTVGGVLSMGGIGPQSFKYGAVVDNVIELDVVTGKGELITCSRTKNPLLFHSVVGGIGQYGIIVRAKMKMQRALPLARNYLLLYFDLDAMLADANTLTSQGRVDGIYLRIFPDGNGGWLYGINAVKWYSSNSPPDDGTVIGGLSYFAPALEIADMDAFTYDAIADDVIFAALDAAGLYSIRHVWGDLFLPASKTSDYVRHVLQTLTVENLGPDGGFILLFPVRNRFPDTPAFRLPCEDQVFLFDVLTSGSLSDPGYVATHVAMARRLYEGARDLGGTVYPIGSTPMAKTDWIQHYGPLYPALAFAKALFDPSKILAPGPGIF